MHAVLRRLMEWRGRRLGAQIIVFDGAAELEKKTAFVKGAASGIFVATILLALTAPSTLSPRLTEEIQRREMLLQVSNERADQALQVANMCLATAQNLERTLAAYQAFLGTGTSVASSPRNSEWPGD
jgi:hypothetical protein